MSVHAAKGLEFPIVVLADMGRAPRGGGQSPRILHDPMFGLVCQVREENGDWAKPMSYRWAEWLDGRMEQAESKRLLYVACTRAADLLILSGSAKENGSWLGTLAAAWDLDLGEERGREDGGPRRRWMSARVTVSALCGPSRPTTKAEEGEPRHGQRRQRLRSC